MKTMLNIFLRKTHTHTLIIQSKSKLKGMYYFHFLITDQKGLNTYGMETWEITRECSIGCSLRTDQVHH